MTETPTRDDDEGEDDEARREATEFEGRAVPVAHPCHVAPTQRDPVGTPDWLTAQAKAIGTARPKPPKGVYRRGWRRSS